MGTSDHRYDQFRVKRLAKKFSEMRVLDVALFPPRKPGRRRTHNTGPVQLGIQQRRVEEQGSQY